MGRCSALDAGQRSGHEDVRATLADFLGLDCEGVLEGREYSVSFAGAGMFLMPGGAMEGGGALSGTMLLLVCVEMSRVWNYVFVCCV